MSAHSLHPLAELRAWLSASAQKFRALRQFSPVVRFDVAGDIAADAIAASAATSVSAHRAETQDREALRLIDGVLHDGRVIPAELSALRRARALVAHSAETDHDIAEKSAVPPA